MPIKHLEFIADALGPKDALLSFLPAAVPELETLCGILVSIDRMQRVSFLGRFYANPPSNALSCRMKLVFLHYPA
jgi:hypothetical protein